MHSTRQARLTSQAIDVGCILIALAISGMWGKEDGGAGWSTTSDALAHGLLFSAIWLLITSRLGSYNITAQRDRKRAVTSLIEAWTMTWGIAGLIAVTTLGHPHPSIWLVLGLGFTLLLLVRMLLVSTPLGNPGGQPRTLVIGASSNARALSSGKEANRNMRFVGFVPFQCDDPREMPHLEQVGTLERVDEALAAHHCDLALICPTPQSITRDIHHVFRVCDQSGLGVHYFPPFLDLDHLRVNLTWSDSRRGLALQTLPNQTAAQLAKRAIDMIGATVGLVALLPVFAACITAVKLTSRGPIFFRQERIGKNGNVFTCLKFRTMRVGAQAQQELLRAASVQDGPAFKIPDDPRVTSIGRFLRKFSLDELPQLINVLCGDMSLVGPRPPIPSEVENYSWWQRRRISVKPGLTCVWQVWGRNRVSFKRWVEMDLFYIDNWSLWLDFKLIAHTFRAVLKGTGM